MNTASEDTTKSRQVLRAENRQAVKDLRRHSNEDRNSANKARNPSPLHSVLNRAGRRKFTSNRADQNFRAAVMDHLGEMAKAAA